MSDEDGVKELMANTNTKNVFNLKTQALAMSILFLFTFLLLHLSIIENHRFISPFFQSQGPNLTCSAIYVLRL